MGLRPAEPVYFQIDPSLLQACFDWSFDWSAFWYVMVNYVPEKIAEANILIHFLCQDAGLYLLVKIEIEKPEKSSMSINEGVSFVVFWGGCLVISPQPRKHVELKHIGGLHIRLFISRHRRQRGLQTAEVHSRCPRRPSAMGGGLDDGVPPKQVLGTPNHQQTQGCRCSLQKFNT